MQGNKNQRRTAMPKTFEKTLRAIELFANLPPDEIASRETRCKWGHYAPGEQILDRDTIANATRGREVMPLERIVDMAVSRLRQRLRDTGKSPRLIRTVRGSGYLLATQVTPHHESAH